MSSPQPTPPARRNTLRILLLGGLAAVAAPVAYVVTRYLKPPRSSAATTMVAPESAMGPGSARIVKVGSVDAIVMRGEKGELYALNMRCTHAGCNVNWKEQERVLACPCHGGEYNSKGEVIKGPPPAPLKRLQVKVEDGSIFVTDEQA